MDDRKLNIRFTEGDKKIVIDNYEIRGADPYKAREANSRIALFLGEANNEAEDDLLHELNVHLYDVDANADLGTIVACVDHRDEGLVEIDTDIAPFFIRSK